MYLTTLKGLVVDALKRTFDHNYPEADFRKLAVSIEFPVKRQQYPGIWVDYEPVGELRRAGIGHTEYDTGESGLGRQFTRWRFQGNLSFTIVAMTSLERDRLHDEMVKTLAFGGVPIYPSGNRTGEVGKANEFRRHIEESPYLAVNMDFDEITTRGFAATPGTPWQSEDLIYEAEIVMECLGEFVADEETWELVPIEQINVYPYREGETEVEGVRVEDTRDDSPGDPGPLPSIDPDGDDGDGVWI